MRTRLTALLAAGLLAAGGATLTPAQAAPSQTGAASRSTTAAERQAVRDYWTSERMATAIPGDARVRPMARGGGGGGGKPGGGGSGGGGGSVPVGDDVLPTGSPTLDTTVGKVFFTSAGTRYVCSGSGVTAGNESLVVTASHCVHDGDGVSDHFVSNFLYVPGYTNGSAPNGEWASVRLFAGSTNWDTSAGDFTHDVGFAKVETHGGGTLSDALGAQGITFGRGPGLTTTSYGYPAAAPFDGQTRRSCGPGTTIRDPYGSQTQGLKCDMTGGSSGGPWYLTIGGGLYAHSVNSYKYTGGAYKGYMFGPYFDATIKTLYTAAASS